MQKMLVLLVLALTGAVAILSFSVYSLSDDLEVAILSFSVYSLSDDLDGLRLSQGRSRGTDGNWDISADEIEYAIALQKKVDRKRRIDSMVRSVTRRLDGLIEKGELEAIPEEHAEKFNETVASYLSKSDDLMTRLFREPTEEIRQLDRREMAKTEREALQAEAQNELAGILTDDQAQTVADAMFRRGRR